MSVKKFFDEKVIDVILVVDETDTAVAVKFRTLDKIVTMPFGGRK